MEWYIPISLLPGIALLILSTSNFIIALNNEVQALKEKGEASESIIKLKIKQLKRLSISISGFYLSVLFFTLSGFFASLSAKSDFIFLLTGIGIMTLSLIMLIAYAISAISIRTKHLLME